ncbi:hypothetical protein SAMN05443662_0095 [Sulfurivirga caldicuralii]|uniref:Uncharacterized protein n=1 Tax=Sulfurivirga caldicuralii TaxID=364032 RepID=A0A1N6DFC9_9GAMM|nr:hypothetical protein [Sulfurivirga caldicuralii]SIN69383.1 hypothetical protein SAMN05443662_0095 [Sulfurivirga caldicuralii]
MLNKLKNLPVFLQVLLFAIFATLGAWLLLPEPTQQPDKSALPWNSFRDEQGRVHALGLVIGQSTLRDAMALYGKDVEIKEFTDPDLQPTSVEAYFPAVYIVSIKSPLILRLKVDPQRMQALLKEAPGVRATPSGDKEVLLSEFQARTLLDAPIESITLPASKDLPKEAILKRFGQPTHIRKNPADKTERWIYPQKGLEIIMDPEGKEVFEWANFIRG